MNNTNVASNYLDELETMREGTIADYKFVGDYNDSCARIYIQNLSRLNWDKDGGRWPYICKVLDSNKSTWPASLS